MAIDYEAVKREWPKMKSALTRAKNRKDWKKVIAVCDAALDRFNDIGYPDDWRLFESAKRDAQWAIQRAAVDRVSSRDGR